MDYLKFNLVGQNVLPPKKMAKTSRPKRPGQNILDQIVRGQNVRWPNCPTFVYPVEMKVTHHIGEQPG